MRRPLEGFKICPFCGGTIALEAEHCGHCGRKLGDESRRTMLGMAALSLEDIQQAPPPEDPLAKTLLAMPALRRPQAAPQAKAPKAKPPTPLPRKAPTPQPALDKETLTLGLARDILELYRAGDRRVKQAKGEVRHTLTRLELTLLQQEKNASDLAKARKPYDEQREPLQREREHIKQLHEPLERRVRVATEGSWRVLDMLAQKDAEIISLAQRAEASGDPLLAEQLKRLKQERQDLARGQSSPDPEAEAAIIGYKGRLNALSRALDALDQEEAAALDPLISAQRDMAHRVKRAQDRLAAAVEGALEVVSLVRRPSEELLERVLAMARRLDLEVGGVDPEAPQAPLSKVWLMAASAGACLLGVALAWWTLASGELDLQYTAVRKDNLLEVTIQVQPPEGARLTYFGRTVDIPPSGKILFQVPTSEIRAGDNNTMALLKVGGQERTFTVVLSLDYRVTVDLEGLKGPEPRRFVVVMEVPPGRPVRGEGFAFQEVKPGLFHYPVPLASILPQLKTLQKGAFAFPVTFTVTDGQGQEQKRTEELIIHLPPLILTVESPLEGATVTATPVEVRGKVNPPSTALRVAGAPIQVGPSGEYKALVTLEPGEREIPLEATCLGYGSAAITRKVVIREPLETWARQVDKKVGYKDLEKQAERLLGRRVRLKGKVASVIQRKRGIAFQVNVCERGKGCPLMVLSTERVAVREGQEMEVFGEVIKPKKVDTNKGPVSLPSIALRYAR